MPTARMSRTSTSARTYAHRASPMAPADRRAAIVDAVLPLLASRGTAVTSRELALAAGVAEGTIFKVFTDKEDLFRTAVDRVADPELTERSIRAIDPTLPYEQRLLAAAVVVQRRLVDIWSILSKVGWEGTDSADSPTRQRQMPPSPATIELFAAEPGRIRVTPEEAAQKFRALVLAFSHPVLYDPPPSADTLVDFFLHGIAASS
jgi:AcrR family transcriptional regulator